MPAVVLGLASSLAWGFSDFFGGLQSRHRPVLAVLAATQSAGLVLVIVVAVVRGEGPPAPREAGLLARVGARRGARGGPAGRRRLDRLGCRRRAARHRRARRLLP